MRHVTELSDDRPLNLAMISVSKLSDTCITILLYSSWPLVLLNMYKFHWVTPYPIMKRFATYFSKSCDLVLIKDAKYEFPKTYVCFVTQV